MDTSIRVSNPCRTGVVLAILRYNFSKISHAVVPYPYPYLYLCLCFLEYSRSNQIVKNTTNHKLFPFYQQEQPIMIRVRKKDSRHKKCMASELLSRPKMQWKRQGLLGHPIIYIGTWRCELRICNSINWFPRVSVLVRRSTMHGIFSNSPPFHDWLQTLSKIDMNP